MANRNRTAGHNYERQIIKELKELGFPDCVSSRSESKNLDNKGVDVVSNTLPIYVQIKTTKTSLNYDKIFKSFSLTDKPLVIFHKKTIKKLKKFVTSDEYVILKKDLFYDLLTKKL